MSSADHDFTFDRPSHRAGGSLTESPPQWQRDGYAHVWMPYCQMKTAPLPLAVQRTEGVSLHLSDGRRLIDGLASWWSACHGYNHPHVIDAMRRQLETMSHVMFGGINHEPALTLARRLAAMLPGDLNRVFFCDSGSVAVEVAMKMAIQYYRNRGQQGRTRFVSFANAYHGDTTGAMSLCDPQRSMHSKFDGALLSQWNVPIPSAPETLDRFRTVLHQHHDQLAGVIIEPLVQGAGGMRFHSADTLRRVAECCHEFGVLMIADELATGFGRTGSMFAVEQAGITPDILCLGKALSAGMIGLAATVATEDVFQTFWSEDGSKALMHGPTFMANPLACAAANASLDLFEREPRLAQVREIESRLETILSPCREIDRVVDVRVKGAIGVLQVDALDQIDRLRAAFIERGVFVRPFGDCIYTTPPLVISADELEKVAETIVSVTKQWARWPRP